MPSSRPNIVPAVIHLLRQIKPRSILDIGVGFGKWGHLFREYTDINEAERDPARYQRQNWQVRIDGIEGHAEYLTPMHRFLYDRIHLGNAPKVLRGLTSYDLIFLGDIIEHFDKEDGFALLTLAMRKARRAVIVSTPKYDTGQEDLCGNELERHRSLWSVRDFKRLPGARVKTIDRETLLAVFPKNGVGTLEFTSPKLTKDNTRRRMLRLRQRVKELIPRRAPFILIDDEQIRSLLPHQRAIPFLEKDGVYWGPPADDATAWRELERLKGEGARFLVLIWSCFWWKDRYRRFCSRLRKQFACIAEDDCLWAFDLRKQR